jgi:L-seryl-tRNA(Ser) seleniumtransferase
MAHRHDLPVIVDAAGELPPRENLKRIPATGADLVAFSGGKAIRGPQSTGILCGRRDLISSAALQMLDMDDHLELWDPPIEFIDRSPLAGIPRHGIGRALKVSKEEIIALLTALDLFSTGAYDDDPPRLLTYLKSIEAGLQNAHAKCRIFEPDTLDRWAILEIAVDEQTLGRTAFDVCKSLRDGSPPVYVGHGKLSEGTLVVNPLCLNEESTDQLTRRLLEELQKQVSSTCS